MSHSRRAYLWRTVGVAAAIAVCISVLGGTTSLARSTAKPTVTFAEFPSLIPNYIFPMASGAYTNIANIAQFEQLMFLPLYWFGDDGQPKLNETLSLAKPPVFSDNNRIVTISMKHWNWANGDPVTARDVVFWMNLLSAVTDPNAPSVGSSTAPGPGWGAAVPGGFPENVVSYSQTGTYSVVLKLNASYNPTWYLYNELSQVHPIPQSAWDKLSTSGAVGNSDASAEARIALPNTTPTQYVPSDPGTANSGALGVAQYLNSQSQHTNSYATNPLWKVVDGPFQVSQYTSSGYVKFVPNARYSGAPKPQIGAFEELPYTSDASEYNAVRAGSVDYGYIPVEDLSQRAALKKQGYIYNSWFDFESFYLTYNYTNTTDGPIFKQLYFRQAVQSLINQPQYIRDALGGIGTVENGPVPPYPPRNADLSPLAGSSKPYYPYNPSKAVALLKQNGWKVAPGGVTSCEKPGTSSGECGAGIALGQKLSFQLIYLTGFSYMNTEMAAIQSSLRASAGIDLALKAEPLSSVTGAMFATCTPAQPCNNWSMGYYDGWTFTPDYYPSGEELFYTGSGYNAGDYSSPTNDANITATTTAPTSAAESKAMYAYEDYLVKQLPAAWLPMTPEQLSVYKSGLKGVVPQGIYVELYPQQYSLTH